MALTDVVVLLVVFAGTVAFAVLLRRRGIRGRRLLAPVWLSFYGLMLTAMMLAHSIEVVYRTVAARAAVSSSASLYNFRVYSLLLLGAVLIGAGMVCLRAAPRLALGSIEARRAAVRASAVVLAIVAPLIPIQKLFGILLTVLSVLSLLVLTRRPRTHETVAPEVEASSRAPVVPT